VTAAITSCAISRPSTLPLAVEGLLILGYLLLLDIPRAIPRQATPRWARQQLPVAFAGLATSGAVLAGLALPAASSWWIVLTGMSAAVAAVLIALPRAATRPRGQRPVR
jgi:hypothetical protein